MLHINQATFAEFEADFGASRRINWGNSMPEEDVLSPSVSTRAIRVYL